MARGPKKSLEEKISDKMNVIEALKIRIKSEQVELEGLLKEKQNKDMEQLNNLLNNSGISTDEAQRIIQEYLERNTQQTA